MTRLAAVLAGATLGKEPSHSAATDLLQPFVGPPTRRQLEATKKALLENSETQWRQRNDAVLARARNDEPYRRDMLAALKAVGKGKRGGQGDELPPWAPAFIYDSVEEDRRTVTSRATGRPMSIDAACELLGSVLDRDSGTVRNVYYAEKRARGAKT